MKINELEYPFKYRINDTWQTYYTYQNLTH